MGITLKCAYSCVTLAYRLALAECMPLGHCLVQQHDGDRNCDAGYIQRANRGGPLKIVGNNIRRL